MKTIDELRSFFQSELMGQLEDLEIQRKVIVRRTTLSAVIAVGVLIVSFFIIMAANPEALPLMFFLAVLAGAAITGIVHFSSRGYVNDFKSRVIRAIVKWLDPSLSYDAQGYIPQDIYLDSEIFQRHPDRYRGDDLVRGRTGQTDVEFCELHSEYKTEHRDSKGRRRTSWHTIFKGLFFSGDFNKHFSGRTIVLPDTTEKLFGKLAQTFQSWNFSREDLIKLEDPEFEKEFVVYGSDQVEARYILSTSLMKRIVAFKRKSGRAVHLSFVRSRVFVAVSYRRTLFEPRLFKTLLDFEPIREYVEDLQLALGIVEDLNLNTRIWSKT